MFGNAIILLDQSQCKFVLAVTYYMYGYVVNDGIKHADLR